MAIYRLISLLARTTWRSFKLALSFFFNVEVGLPLMGNTASSYCVTAKLHVIITYFIAEYVNSTRILIFILKYPARFPYKNSHLNVLERQISTDPIAKQ